MKLSNKLKAWLCGAAIAVLYLLFFLIAGGWGAMLAAATGLLFVLIAGFIAWKMIGYIWNSWE